METLFVDGPQALGQWLGNLPGIGLDQILPIVLCGLLGALLVLLGLRLAERWHRWQHRRRLQDAKEILILPPAEVDPDGVKLWWDEAVGLLRRSGWRRLIYGPDHIGFELRWQEQELTYVVWVPGTLPSDPIVAAIRAAWPGAATKVRAARTPLTVLAGPAGHGARAASTSRAGQSDQASLLVDEDGALSAPAGFELFEAGRWVSAKMAGWYTFRHRTDHGVDPVRALIEQGTGLGAGHSACVQILVRPLSRRRVWHIRSGAAGLKTGRTQRSSGLAAGVGRIAVRVFLAAADFALEMLVAIFSTLTGPSAGPRSRPSTRSSTGGSGPVRSAGANPLQDQDVRPGLDKVRTGQLWEVRIRLGVIRTVAEPKKTSSTAARKARRQKIQAGLHQRCHALAAALMVHDDRNGLRAGPLPDPARILGQRRMDSGFVMGTPELASLAALPTDLAVPGLDRAQARTVAAPIGLPSGGRDVKVLGHSLVDGRAVGLSVPDSRQHLHVLGATGVGKSTLMNQMIMNDINAGRGVVLIDPKGDLALDVLDRIPTHAIPRVTLIDPDQPSGSASFNPLQLPARGDAILLVDNLTAIFSGIFGTSWGPRMDDTMRVACLTLMRRPGARLSMVPALLSNKQVRAPLTADLNDASGLGGFWEWYDSAPAAVRSQVIGPVLARMRSFLLRDFVRSTIGRETSTFDLGQVLDGGILIVRIPKGQLGEDASKLMGSMLLAAVWQAATARASVPESRRKDAAVYIDESHNVLNLSVPVTDMLAEARAYHVSFVLAHQNLSQLPREVQSGLSANARNKVYFTCSPEDARQLAEHTTPTLNEHDLSHLGAFTAATRLMAGNRQMPAFTLTTTPMPAPGATTRQQVREHVRRTGPSTDPEDLPSETETP
ncbi:hypothetical protein GCM10027456_77270 [Kineosporia babensis]